MSISLLAAAALRVINAAWQNGPSYDLASQAAFALDSAQLLQSPETAAEHAKTEEALIGANLSLFEEERDHARTRLAGSLARKRAARMRAERDELRASLREACDQIAGLESELGGVTAQVAELEAAASSTRTADEDPIAYSLTAKATDPHREKSVAQLRALLAGQPEDPHDSPLHHTYRLGHDLEAQL